MSISESSLVLPVDQRIPRKNHHGVLQVFWAVQSVDACCALAIVGTGPLKKSLRRTSDEMGLRNVVLPGHVQPSELWVYDAAADLFVDLSLRDHWSQVVGEAMAAGLPVLVSEKAHAHERVEDGISGFVLDPLDTSEAVRTSTALLVSPARARQMGEAAYRAVVTHAVHQTVAVFLECLGDVKSGARAGNRGVRNRAGTRP